MIEPRKRIMLTPEWATQQGFNCTVGTVGSRCNRRAVYVITQPYVYEMKTPRMTERGPVFDKVTIIEAGAYCEACLIDKIKRVKEYTGRVFIPVPMDLELYRKCMHAVGLNADDTPHVQMF